MKSEHAADRATGTLAGLALGDALGMPTQSLSPREIADAYGRVLAPTDAAPPQQIAAGMPAGSVTDDTEQALLVADLLIAGSGRLDAGALAHALLDWEDAMIARGSLDLLGPSTKSALEAVRAGANPEETGRTGTTNGAAMRVAPVGIANGCGQRRAFAEAVYESCRVTHDTVHGFRSAALVAAAVSLGIDGAHTADAIDHSLELVEGLPAFGAWNPKADVAARTREALALSGRIPDDSRFAEALRATIGTSVEANESIPCAFALAQRYRTRPHLALVEAANLGGDTDTIGAIAGAVLGASIGMSAWPVQWWNLVGSVSGIDIATRVAALLAIRQRA